jgi:hypothetical protein
MSTFAAITWGIVAGFTILQAIEILTDYIEGYINHRRFHKAVSKFEDEWEEYVFELEPSKPVRKKKTAKKTVKRR